MSLINVNNSRAVRGQVRSVQVTVGNSTIAYIDQATTVEYRSYLALTYGNGKASNLSTGYVANVLGNLFVGEWSLYEIQARLNDDEWRETGISAEVELGINTTGHGDVSDRSHEVVLLVKTTWQDKEVI